MITHPRRPIRMLHIGQDDLFAGLDGVQRRFVPTGHSITPASPGRKPLSWTSLWQLVAGLRANSHYDVMVLPTLRFDWPYDRSQLKRRLRRVAAGVIRQPLLRRRIDRWLRGRAEAVVALDRFDTPEIATPYIQALPALSAYFKTNLRVGEQDRRIGSCTLQYLPYWIAADNYPDPGEQSKDIDILFLGAVNSPERDEGLRVLASMEGAYRIVAPEGRVPFDEYCRLTARAWLTLSPQGYGYNGFRHYEAMLLWSVPVINRPEEPIVHDFVDGQNCLLYEPGRLRERLEAALADRRHLAQMSRGLRRFALAHHSFDAVGWYVLQQVWAAPSPSQAQRLASGPLHESALRSA